MIKYYSPYLFFTDLFKIPLISDAENKIIEKYKSISNKKYILITNSCRSALELAYSSLDKHGDVLTSPLTCQVAIQPIINTKNNPVYVDININTLNICADSIEQSINEKSIAIQAIHLGGVLCDMPKIVNLAKKYNLKIIEDCAQSYRSKLSGKYAGSFGDIACYTIMKNSFSIGGGILATNDKEIFLKAQEILINSPKNKFILSFYRIIRHLIETKRHLIIFQTIFDFLIKLRRINGVYKNKIMLLNKLDLAISLIQLQKEKKINYRKKNIGDTTLKFLQENNLMKNYVRINNISNFYPKFFIYDERYDTKKMIKILKKNKIDAKHLEYKQFSDYQEKIALNTNLISYHKVHDSLISLPLPINNSEEYLGTIQKIFRKYIKDNRLEKNNMV